MVGVAKGDTGSLDCRACGVVLRFSSFLKIYTRK